MTKNINPVKLVEDPQLDFSYLFEPQQRPEGLSGLLRVRNEEEYLAQSIDSVIEILDELIIVYNNCQDQTPQIVQQYANRYPEKIKAFHYLPVVYPPYTAEFHQTPGHSQHNLAYYYNFTLQQSGYRYLIKLDGDIIYYKERFQKAYQHFKQIVNQKLFNHQVKKHRKTDNDPELAESQSVKLPYYCINGINILSHLGQTVVNLNELALGFDNDVGFFSIESLPFFIKNSIGYESLLFAHEIEIFEREEANQSCFVHVKRGKANFGFDNQFSHNITLHNLIERKNQVINPRLVTFEAASQSFFHNLPNNFFTINEKYRDINYVQSIEQFFNDRIQQHCESDELHIKIVEQEINPIIRITSPQLNPERLKINKRLPGISYILILLANLPTIEQIVNEHINQCHELVIVYHRGVMELGPQVQAIANKHIVKINPYYYDIVIDSNNHDVSSPHSLNYLNSYIAEQSERHNIQIYHVI